MAFNWEIKSTFDSTPTDRPAVKVKVALPLFKALHGKAGLLMRTKRHSNLDLYGWSVCWLDGPPAHIYMHRNDTFSYVELF